MGGLEEFLQGAPDNLDQPLETAHDKDDILEEGEALVKEFGVLNTGEARLSLLPKVTDCIKELRIIQSI